MDQTALVADAQGVGRELVKHLELVGVPVSAAFWFWDDEAQESRLAIVSPYIDEKGSAAAYERIVEVLQQHPEVASLWLMARITAMPTAQLRHRLVHGYGYPSQLGSALWIAGGPPHDWLSRVGKDQQGRVGRS